MPIPKGFLDEIALSPKEYRLIMKRLGREPNLLELGMFGSLWSEHCGYKHSRPLLKRFPTHSPRVLIGPGEENAGVVDIGYGLAVVMKVESHNHPSAIEPYQGAATGVGGIVRDIFTMGARPIALMNSLRFGPLSQARNRYLFQGVVGGIADYGNCLGIPDVGGEVFFSPAYTHNPLVNALCLGIASREKILRARASGPGNLLVLVGAATGKDGLHGASGLASRTFEAERELRTAVQVGNPFMEKLLLEACLELVGKDYIIGLQDLGAAGLTSASVEAAARGGCGVEIDVAKVPRRDEGMTPYEVMLAESQERMLVVVRRGYEDKVLALFHRWGLPGAIIGQVTEDGVARIKEGQEVVAQVPVALLIDPPLYRRRGVIPFGLEELQKYDLSEIPDVRDAGEALLRLLASPNIASREWVYRQYDHQVLTNTVVGPGADAAVLRIKDTPLGIALAMDGNGRVTYLNPSVGGALAVAEAARNLSCAGAEPIAITDCLNFGNPERQDVYYQLREAINGMAKACHRLGIPVISGNVSLYNETRGEPVYPTPVVGMVGLLEEVARYCTSSFKEEGDIVVLLGDEGVADVSSLAGSEYLEAFHGLVAGMPSLDLAMEARVQLCCREAIREGIIRSAHDCSEGGLAVALAEAAIQGDLGFQGERLPGRVDAALFGERPSRIVVSLDPLYLDRLTSLTREHGVPWRRLGVVGGRRFSLEGLLDLSMEHMASAWRKGLEQALG